MGPYLLRTCTVADASELARNNMSAFWEDTNWRLVWPKDRTLAYIIEQCTKRVPQNLVRDRVLLRHQVAVDPDTGRILGYARWKLPVEIVVKAAEDEAVWPEARVPDVSPAERAEIDKRHAEGDWTHVDHSSIGPSLDIPVSAMKRRVMDQKPYLSLDYLAVHPENKGRGVATQLVESGIRQAELLGLDLCILAFKAGLGVYTRLGFRIVDQLIQDDSMFGGPGEWATYMVVYDTNKPVPASA